MEELTYMLISGVAAILDFAWMAEAYNSKKWYQFGLELVLGIGCTMIFLVRLLAYMF